MDPITEEEAMSWANITQRATAQERDYMKSVLEMLIAEDDAHHAADLALRVVLTGYMAYMAPKTVKACSA